VIPLLFDRDREQPLRVLCLGAHCDDIEIGCGGTLLRLREWYPTLEMRWLVLSSDERRAAETRASAKRFGVDPADVVTLPFRDGFLPYEGAAVKDAVLARRGDFAPDLVFTHYRDDRHQDHRVVSEIAWNLYRDHLILEFEIPKWDGDLGSPGFFVRLEAAHVEQKLAIVEQEYASQHEKHAFDVEAFRGLMALRGVECRAPSGYAEAFHARKVLLDGSV
jgi:LmbE family N-acetylglucosaminyl deacetylase